LSSNSRFKNSGERRPNADQDNDPQNRDKERESEAGGTDQHAVEQDVHHNRTQYREGEWHVTVDQEQNARNQLERENDQEIVRNGDRSEDELKESIQAKDREDRGEKEPTDGSYDLHANTIGLDMPACERPCFLSQYAAAA
jgi:hypothetical protein